MGRGGTIVDSVMGAKLSRIFARLLAIMIDCGKAV